MTTNVLQYLEESEKSYPDKIVFADDNNSISYTDLVDQAKRVGTHINKKINGALRKPIVVFVDRKMESVLPFFGVAYSGNFYVPIDMQMPLLRIELILKTLNPVAILANGSDVKFALNISDDLLIIKYEDAINETIDEVSIGNNRRSIVDTDPLYATFTSGSTGVPKGVITCHRSVVDLTEDLVDTFGFTDKSIFGNQNPFYFDASIKDIFCTLKCAATMFVIPKTCFIFPAKLVEFMQKYEINSILWSAAAIALVANTKAFEKEKPEKLMKVMFSGEVMHNKVLNYWRKALPETMFVNLYGPTEITSVCSYYIVDKPYQDDDILPIGIPFDNTEIILLNSNNQIVKGDEIGEICVKGTCLAMGYFNNPEKTEEAFCQNPLNKHYPEIIYRTGDIARYNEEGQIMFLSRKDNQVKHMGQRIELGEIEILINSLESIDASICFYDHDKQKIVLVYQGERANNKYIIEGIKDKFPKYMFPNIMIGLEEMPYNLNGKIDRTLLKSKYKDGTFSAKR
jgi:D-alanine--poly(phosphoribitol) ligase subunit 1